MDKSMESMDAVIVNQASLQISQTKNINFRQPLPPTQSINVDMKEKLLQ